MMAWTSSTYQPGKTRWAELTLTRHGEKYTITATGRTTVDGETDREQTYSTRVPENVIDALCLHDDDGTYLPKVCRRVLVAASEYDEPLRLAANPHGAAPY
jgi:hypothetical protein